MPRVAIALALVCMLAPGSAGAIEKPPELAKAPEAAAIVGAASFRVLFWRVFDASLWSRDGAFDWDTPFALSLTYAREFTAHQLTTTTVEEMARLSGKPLQTFSHFGAEFMGCIDDVGIGDRITAVSVTQNQARLFLNGEERCALERPELRRQFFGIWLARNSAFPDETARLIGAGP